MPIDLNERAPGFREWFGYDLNFTDVALFQRALPHLQAASEAYITTTMHKVYQVPVYPDDPRQQQILFDARRHLMEVHFVVSELANIFDDIPGASVWKQSTNYMVHANLRGIDRNQGLATPPIGPLPVNITELPWNTAPKRWDEQIVQAISDFIRQFTNRSPETER